LSDEAIEKMVASLEMKAGNGRLWHYEFTSVAAIH
jgi:hypothetical protein